jgi:hypothetical protein
MLKRCSWTHNASREVGSCPDLERWEGKQVELVSFEFAGPSRARRSGVRTSNIPNGERDVLVLDGLDVESWRKRRRAGARRKGTAEGQARAMDNEEQASSRWTGMVGIRWVGRRKRGKISLLSSDIPVRKKDNGGKGTKRASEVERGGK